MFEHLTLAQKIGQLLMVGFLGTIPSQPDIQTLSHHIAESRVGGIISYKRNIEDAKQIAYLNEFLSRAAQEKGLPLLVKGVDQEGQGVLRLNTKNGFSDTPSAKEIAAKPFPEVRSLYGELARNVKEAGFTLDFAPCVDLDIAGVDGSAIGKWGRSYGNDVETVVSYGGIMIEALREQGCLSCVKHYPGHGSAGKKKESAVSGEGDKNSDTHLGFVDVTDVWEERELEPFFALGPKAGAVMTAHVFNRKLDPDNPATLSSVILSRLRAQCPNVTIITDCLQMEAIQQTCGSFKNAVIRALQAGGDVIVYANNPRKLGQPSAPGFEPGPDLPERFLAAVQNGLRRGELTEAQINEKFERVMAMKARLV